MAANLIRYDELEDVEDRFVHEECVGTGVFGRVHGAKDTASNGKRVAVKIQKFLEENEHFVQEEYRVLRDFCHHLNLPDFFGVFKNVAGENREIWFIMELCEGGPIIDLVSKLLRKNRRMAEEHIGFVLKEVVKALTYLHKSHVVHRDVRGSNILMTSEGEIKLVDFGLSRRLNSTFAKTDTSLGSPFWMAPEVVTSTGGQGEEEKYGNRADVWAVGITAIELGDGKTPFRDMHPTRALFQIVRNPPPTLYRPANWSEVYNDFISECLIKNPEHRPFMEELLQHPFLSAIPENNYHFAQELKSLRQNLADFGDEDGGYDEGGVVYRNFLKTSIDAKPEKTVLEDLAALDDLSEGTLLEELEARMSLGLFQTFVGDVLLVLNPNELQNIYGAENHKKYKCKSRSDNAPHVYAVADSAYQHAIHHVLPQNILLLGESGAGKTNSFVHLLTHLLYLGENDVNINGDRIMNGVKLLQAFTNSATPANNNSTRSVFKADVVYGRSGKITGAIFNVLQLEKMRVSSKQTGESNFHVLRFIYDSLSLSKNLHRYHLEEGRRYRYLRGSLEEEEARDFERIETTLEEYEFTIEQVESIRCVLVAVILIGEIEYVVSENETVAVKNGEQVAELLKVDGKKLARALTNFSVTSKGAVIRKSATCDDAESARDVLANNLYARLVDYLVNVINHKLSYGRAIFGEHYSIRILDMFGFECLRKNELQQLLVNTFNEQMRYLYSQRIFAWEALETNEENLPFTPIYFYDNKTTIDEVLSKQGGLFTYIDDATKNYCEGKRITDNLKSKGSNNRVETVSESEFSIAHYPGRVCYDVEGMPKRNRDFLPAEVIEVLGQSDDPVVKLLFTAKLNRSGNLVVTFDDRTVRDQNTSVPEVLHSQTNQAQTATATYRAVCLDLLKELSVGGGTGGTHFVLCVRSDLDGKPRGFHKDVVSQQLRALAVLETAKARQKGYPHRIMCPEFLRRYKSLAFGFDETVEITRDNCRLLLVRLKMEGWMIGKTKVFLKYYNEEYLTRLYETQVRKVVKIQCMMRSFLVRRRLAKKLERERERAISQLRRGSQLEMTPEEAAIILQKAYRGITARKIYGPLVSKTGKLDEETRDFIKPYSNKWKSKSMFQVILQYRAAKCHDFFNMSQQVHFFNQKTVHNLHLINKNVDLNCIELNAQASAWLDDMRPPVLKLPFRLDEVPYFDTSYMCDPGGASARSAINEDVWDSPFQWRENLSSQITFSLLGREQESEALCNTKLINVPYTRDPQAYVQEPTEMATVTEKEAMVEEEEVDDIPDGIETKVEEVEEPPPIVEVCEIKKHLPPANPIAELQHLARRLSRSEDDPPFDFQGMLRKTNFQRESLKRALQTISRRQSKTENDAVSLEARPLKRHGSVDTLKARVISAEIAPGIFMEGLVTDL